MRENSWLSYTEEDDKNVEVLAQEYKEFLSKCKTERECTQYFIKEAESHGYQNLNKLIAQGTRLKQEIKYMVSAWVRQLLFSRLESSRLPKE